ncbi:MAG: transketolase family protein [Actinobacteria bacterium]|nr:transketolase family protein [Actinomycetota bacterium]
MATARAIRDAFAESLVELGKVNKKVVVLDADLAHCSRTSWFAKEYPERFFNAGIAEQNMVGMAAGLATTGLIPFAHTFGFLFSSRALDQVRTSICYPKLNVKLAGGYSGLSNPPDGATHHSICDLAIMRSLPNMTVISVSGDTQTEQAVTAAAEHQGPVYLRLARTECPLSCKKQDFKIGRAVEHCSYGDDVAIIATGLALANAIKAAELLLDNGIQAEVMEIHTLKPIDSQAILDLSARTKAVVTVEEHSIIGGLGGAVAELLSEGPCVPLERVGIRDTFTESGTTYEALIEKYGLAPSDIIEAVERVLKRR